MLSKVKDFYKFDSSGDFLVVYEYFIKPITGLFGIIYGVYLLVSGDEVVSKLLKISLIIWAILLVGYALYFENYIMLWSAITCFLLAYGTVRNRPSEAY